MPEPEQRTEPGDAAAGLNPADGDAAGRTRAGTESGRLVGTVQDVTGRSTADEARAWLAAIVEHSSDAIVGRALDGTITSWNAAAERMLGYTAAEVIGRDPMEMFPPEARPKIAANRDLIKAGRIVSNYETVRLAKDGRRIDVAASFSAVRDFSGRVIGSAGVLRDITERKRIEAELRRSEQRFHKLALATNQIIFNADAQGNPAGENLSWREFTGQTWEQIAGGRWLEAVHPEDRAMVSEVVARGMAERKPYAVENRLRRADGAWRHFAVRAVPILEADGTVREWISACQDITESKTAGIALQASHEQLRVLAARLNTAREEDSALVAREIHDELGQAVTGLKLDLLWLASRLGGDQRLLQEKINAMSSNTDAMIAALRNIASRLRPKMLDDLGLVAAIEAQARDFRERAGVKCEVVADLRSIGLEPERSLAVFRIAQAALTNIARHAAATRADISLHGQSGDLILEVRDNGRGIRDDEIEASSSIGLLGMRERALAAGARFTIVGFPGRGTVVTLRMPMT